MDKLVVHVDMDGVLVDLAEAIARLPNDVRERYGEDVDKVPGLFDDPPPIPGAIEALKRLVESGRFDIHILSTAPWGNPSAWTAKRHWIERHFGNLLEKRITLTHSKDLVSGDFLIDDRPNNGASLFSGEWIQFGLKPFETWDNVVNYLLAEGFYWLGAAGAMSSAAKLRDELIYSWLKIAGQTQAPLPSPLNKSILSFNSTTEQGGVSVPPNAHGPHPHPFLPRRMVSWYPSPLDLPIEEWERMANELGIQTMDFIPSETPHRKVQFLNRALKLLNDLGTFHDGDGIGYFEARMRKSKRHSKAVFRGGTAWPVVSGMTLSSHYVQFLNNELAYLFTSVGPTMSSIKTLHMAHLIEGEWAWGKKLNEYAS
jgi:5'(3')-deoxyribonucleotidase